MKKLLSLLCACLALGLVAVGCGDDDSSDDGGAATVEQTTATTETSTSTAEQTDTAKAPATEDVAIEVVDIDYEPAEATVSAGTTITWTNTGDLPHTVTKKDGPGPDLDSGTLQPGDTYEQTLDTPGEISYFCEIHPQQQGSLTVE